MGQRGSLGLVVMIELTRKSLQFQIRVVLGVDWRRRR